MRRQSRLVVVLLVLASLALGSVASAAPRFDPPVGQERTLRVMTRNVYFGADLGPVIEAAGTGDPTKVVVAAADAYVEAYQSDFAFRAAAIADEIASERPALVGLQESTVWDAEPLITGPLQTPLLLQVDFLALILEELADRGLHYTVVEEVEGFDATLPLPVPGVHVTASLTISDVLLRDASIPSADLQVRRVTADNYSAHVSLELPGGPALPFLRQWIAADVVVRGTPARVITTHLESVSGAIRVAQAVELLEGPADTPLPTIVLGDLNSEVDEATDAARLLVLNGFADLGPEGDTCCQDGDLRNDTSGLTSRIDLVLGRGGFTSTDGVRTGVEPLDGSALGVRWASDHAGVATTVVLPR